MPISLVPNRRQFLGTAAASGLLLARGLPAGEERSHDESRFALLADTHIPSDKAIMSSKTNMAANLRGVVEQLVGLERSPAAAFIVGDCAHLEGKPGDYKLFGELLSPLTKTGLPIHLGLGNHDHRQNCLDAFPASADAPTAKFEKRVALVSSKLANWFVLDSLDVVNKTPGLLGEQQLKWLADALDANADKPALIAVHHHLTPIPPTESKVPGLVDTPALLELVGSRKQVKAVFFGHTHVWAITEYQGVHLVNLPPVAYTFGEGHPNGWVDCQLAEKSATLKLLCHDVMHKQHGRAVELAWR